MFDATISSERSVWTIHLLVFLTDGAILELNRPFEIPSKPNQLTKFYFHKAIFTSYWLKLTPNKSHAHINYCFIQCHSLGVKSRKFIARLRKIDTATIEFYQLLPFLGIPFLTQYFSLHFLLSYKKANTNWRENENTKIA